MSYNAKFTAIAFFAFATIYYLGLMRAVQSSPQEKSLRIQPIMLNDADNRTDVEWAAASGGSPGTAAPFDSSFSSSSNGGTNGHDLPMTPATNSAEMAMTTSPTDGTVSGAYGQQMNGVNGTPTGYPFGTERQRQSFWSRLFGEVRKGTRHFLDGLRHTAQVLSHQPFPLTNFVMPQIPLFMNRQNAETIRQYNTILAEHNATKSEILERLEHWAESKGFKEQLDEFNLGLDKYRHGYFEFLVNNTDGEAKEYLNRIQSIVSNGNLSLFNECEELEKADEGISLDAQKLIPVTLLTGPSTMCNVQMFMLYQPPTFNLPFAQNVSQEAFTSFMNISSNRAVSKAQTLNDLKQWAEEHHLKSEYEAYHANETTDRQTTYTNLSKNLAGESLELLHKIWEIAENESLSPAQECFSISVVYNNASVQVRLFLNQAAVLGRLLGYQPFCMLMPVQSLPFVPFAQSAPPSPLVQLQHQPEQMFRGAVGGPQIPPIMQQPSFPGPVGADIGANQPPMPMPVQTKE